MDERRQEPRLRSLLSGRMSFNDRSSAMSCMVRNVSPAGAMILCSDMFRMPEEFDLNIPLHDETRAARIVWRRSDAAGVALAPIEEGVRRKAKAPAHKQWLQGARPKAKKSLVLGY